jgi:hypothetical protein
VRRPTESQEEVAEGTEEDACFISTEWKEEGANALVVGASAKDVRIGE